MTLPTPDSLLPSIAAVKQSLGLQEAQFATRSFAAASDDGAIKATANGMVELVSLEILESQLLLEPFELADKVLKVCARVLSSANADSGSRASAAAPTYTLPGFVDVDVPPPTDSGFDRTVGNIVAEAPAVMDGIRQRRFEANDGIVRAVVDGELQLRSLSYGAPLPRDPATLAAATANAINVAITRAKNLFEETVSGTVDDIIGGSHRLILYVGYLDNEHGTRNAADSPSPFDPEPDKTILVSTAGIDGPHDTGVIRFWNLTDAPVIIDAGLQVTTEQANFQIWDSSLPITLAPGQNLVLAETENFNFDTSDTGLGSAPVVSGSVNGRPFRFVDTARALLGREDAGKLDRNETTPYQVLGRIDVPVLVLYAGYLDNVHGTVNPADTPTPFEADANTILLSTGGVATPHDTGVIRFWNLTDAPVIIDAGLQVTTEQANFQIWDSSLPITLAPGQNLVLAETENFNFDTSDTGLGSAPVVSGSVNGRPFRFVDTARALLGREDAGKLDRNETTPYQVLGRIDVPVLVLYAGYLDNVHGTVNPADTPTPFEADANTILLSTGGVATPHDTGVIRFWNLTDAPVIIDAGLQVTTEQANFQIWDSSLPITLAPGQNLVLAETENFNFDTSDTGLGSAPVVSGSVNGRPFRFVDTARALLGREDAGKLDRNETTPYQVLGRIDVPVLVLYAGYLDNVHGTVNPADTPTPFEADANTILLSTGGVATPHDTGVIRFWNLTDAPVIIDAGLQVTTEQANFQIWDSSLPITLAPGQNLVLAETENFNFDTSDTGLGSAPVVSGSVNGRPFRFVDTARALLGREDAGKLDRNETTPYQVLGRLKLRIIDDH